VSNPPEDQIKDEFEGEKNTRRGVELYLLFLCFLLLKSRSEADKVQF